MSTELAEVLGDSEHPARGGRHRWWWVLAVGVVAIALVTAGLAWRSTAARATPTETSADAGFARDMQVHHAQAVRMSMIIRDRSRDPLLRTIAYDIALSQQEQIGQLHGWLIQWGLPATGSRPAMAWMAGHDGGHSGTSDGATLLPDGRMPGMATRGALDELAASSGRDADVRFLQLMIAHHRGGVAMAEAAKRLAARPEVRTLAGHIATSQSVEITSMTRMLTERAAPR